LLRKLVLHLRAFSTFLPLHPTTRQTLPLSTYNNVAEVADNYPTLQTGN
jgi:hypothetical protein